MALSPLSNKKFKWAFFILFIIFATLHFYTLFSLGIQTEMAVKDSVISNVILLLLCWSIANNLSFYNPKGNKYFYVIIWCLLLAGIFIFLIWNLFTTKYDSVPIYQNILSNSLIIRYVFSFLLIGCMAAISILWLNQKEQKELEKRKNEAEKLTKEEELYSLRERLQPHFLFNSLNSISALTVSKPQEARKMVHQLSDFLRGTLRKDDSLSSLKSELEHLNLYLEIEKVRFGNRLNTEIEAPAETLEKKIPPMLLQPIVENAIKFGLYDTLDMVTITIKANYIAPYLELKVCNPYDAETAHPNKGTGFGLASIKRRLNLLYNRSDLVKTESKNNQFISTLLIPQIHD